MRLKLVGGGLLTLLTSIAALTQANETANGYLYWSLIVFAYGSVLFLIVVTPPWPKLAKRVLRPWEIRDGLRYQPVAFPLQGKQGPVIGVSLTEPKELRTDSGGRFWITNPKLREQAVQCVIGDDVVTPSYRMSIGWLAHIPDDFENTPVEIGIYEAQWVVEGVPTVTHRFEWDGQTTHTKLSILDRMKVGLRNVLRWISRR
jgi:hypothetical protein